MKCNCKTKCNSCRCAATKGESPKQAAAMLLAARHAVYVNRGRRMLLLDLLEGGTATADDVWDVVERPEGIDASCLAAVPGGLASLGIIRAVDCVRSLRPERHGGLIRVWALADRAAAERWLAEHPDRPDPLTAAGCAGNQVFVSKLKSRNRLGAAETAAAPMMMEV